jgi:hypothetical protein
MKLLFIYGSPAVGKFTVANEVAKITGYKLFHNHLSMDCVKPVFEFGTPSYVKLVRIIRREVITEAAQQNVNLIFTFCYAKEVDDRQVKEITNIVETRGGKVCFVLLKAEKSELEKRVIEESRHRMGKAKSVKVLQYYLDTYELFTPVPHRESLVIDNTNLSPREVALRIVEHYKL